MSEEQGKAPITKVVDNRRKNSPVLIIGYGIIDKEDVTVLIQRLIVLKIQEFGQCKIICPLRYGTKLNDAIKLFKVDTVEVEQSITKGITLQFTITKQLELIQIERTREITANNKDVKENAPGETTQVGNPISKNI